MNLAEQHIYLMFDIQNSLIQKIGEVKILIHKHMDIEKWKNPDLIKQEVIDYFKLERPEWKNSNIQVYYVGDLILSV
jgi:hypothetical protein